MLTAHALWGQISGTISDENGEPLIGATVMVKGTTKGSVADVDGKYQLTPPNGATTLVFSFVGYQTKEEEINGRTVIDVKLEAGSVLNETVIIGYGTQTRKEVTGSVSKVSGEVISKLPVAGIDQAIQGQAPGVQVVNGSGTPGGAVSVRIRGVSSITANNQPLYVVDGIPVTAGSYAQLGAGNQSTNALSDINPMDIESIEVLKDAAAASIYGSRASNGVVLITTKKGKSGKTKISLNTYSGTQRVSKKLDVLTGPEAGALNNQMRRAAGLAIRYADTAGLPSTNWQDEVLRIAPISSFDLNASGGTDKTRFYISGTYFDQEGIVLGSRFNRFSVRANIDNNVSDKFRIGLNSYVSSSKSNRINNDNSIYGVYSAALLSGTQFPVRNVDGTYARDPFSSVENPIATAIEPTFENPTLRTLLGAYAEWDLIPGLMIRSFVGADNLNYRESRFYPTTTAAGAGVNGQGFETYARDLTWTNENTIKYTKSFNNDFKIDLLGGLSFQHANIDWGYGIGENFPGNTIRTLNAASVKKDVASERAQWGMNSVFGRANLTYKTFSLSGLVRSDGSSRFGTEKRYGVFPSVSAAWNIIDEGFMKNQKALSNLKVKLGWGIRGNSGIGNFASRGLIGAGYNYTQKAGLAQFQLANPALGWEARNEINGGLDLGFFNNRVNMTIEYYQANTKDLLLNRPLVYTSGFTSISENIGSMRNKGWDIGITTTNVKNKDFQWSTTFNISTNNNVITKLVSPFASGFGSWVDSGYALGSFRGYEMDGLFQTQAEIDALNAKAVEKNGVGALYQVAGTRPGDIRFKDLNGDGRITADDQRVLGNALPKWYGGLTNNFSYKGFEVSAFLQFNWGNKILNWTRAFAEGMNGQFGQLATTKNYWTPTNTATTMPRAIWGDPNNNRRMSDRWLEDGSYIRLKNLNISYSLPSAMLKRMNVSVVKIFMSANNLWTYTKYQGADPEVSTFAESGQTPVSTSTAANTAPGTDFLTFPQAKTYTFGLNFTF